MTENVLLLAKHLTEKYNTRNPEELCRILGILLISADLPRSVEGFFMEEGGKKAIITGTNLSDMRRRFCIAHELGHALMHKELNNFFLADNTNLSIGRFEREADLFAAALIIDPEDDFPADLELLSRESGIPLSTLTQYINYACKMTA